MKLSEKLISFRIFQYFPHCPFDFLLTEIHTFLQRISFNNSVGDEIMFNDHGELIAGFDVTNLVTFSNNSYIRVKVGRLDAQAPPGKELTIQEDMIEWHPELTQVRK